MALIKISDPKVPQHSFALFELGFRPFFLLAALFAVLSQLVWVLTYTGTFTFSSYYVTGMAWHSHEMLFAYSAAVVSGFLLTAARNWTGQPTLSGRLLLGLVLLWCMGRVLPFVDFVPPVVVATVDFLFLPLLSLALFRPIFRKKQWRNSVFPTLILVMALANAFVHMDILNLSMGNAQLGTLIALYVVLMMIVIMAGRVLPFFIERGAKGARVRRWPVIEFLSVASFAVLALVHMLAPERFLFVCLAGFCALIHAVRLLGWISKAVFFVPMLWVLLMGYAWLVLGLFLFFVSGFINLPPSLALHALTAGSIGVLTLGMMARVSLGHTGRLLTPHKIIIYAFVLVNLAALFRVLMPLVLPQQYELAIVLSSVCWLAAFSAFIVVYAPILIRPRVAM